MLTSTCHHARWFHQIVMAARENIKLHLEGKRGEIYTGFHDPSPVKNEDIPSMKTILSLENTGHPIIRASPHNPITYNLGNLIIMTDENHASRALSNVNIMGKGNCLAKDAPFHYITMRRRDVARSTIGTTLVQRYSTSVV